MKAQESGRTERMGVGIALTAFESIGFAFREQSESDYGIDAQAELIVGEKPTGQLLGIQVKSGSSYLSETDETGFVFRTDANHVEYWHNHALPVLICLCDVEAKAIYWQVVNSQTAVSTGKGFKVTVPKGQTVSSSSRAGLHALLTPVVATDRYTIFKTDDTSHGMAKRYSFEVVLNASLSKAEVATIVRQVTNQGQKRRYHRNDMVKGRWGNSDAHVVWNFVYPSAEDHSRRNHICRSIWISQDLDPRFRPLGFQGENVGDSIIVDWSTNYDFVGTHYSKNTLSKEDYLSKVLPRIGELKQIAQVFTDSLQALAKSATDETAFLAATEKPRQRIDEIHSEISGMPFAPFECRDMDVKLETSIGSLHNIWLLYSEKGRATWDANSRLQQSRDQLAAVQKTLQHLDYEVSKVR